MGLKHRWGNWEGSPGDQYLSQNGYSLSLSLSLSRSLTLLLACKAFGGQGAKRLLRAAMRSATLGVGAKEDLELPIPAIPEPPNLSSDNMYAWDSSSMGAKRPRSRFSRSRSPQVAIRTIQSTTHWSLPRTPHCFRLPSCAGHPACYTAVALGKHISVSLKFSISQMIMMIAQTCALEDLNSEHQAKFETINNQEQKPGSDETSASQKHAAVQDQPDQGVTHLVPNTVNQLYQPLQTIIMWHCNSTCSLSTAAVQAFQAVYR